MTTIAKSPEQEALDKRILEVNSILRPVAGTANWDRLMAYNRSKTLGKSLADFLNASEHSFEFKMAHLADLERVVTTGAWAECPTPPNGQAAATPAPAAPVAALPTVARAPAPVIAVEVTPAPVAPVPAPAPVAASPVPAAADPMAALAAALVPHIKAHIAAVAAPVDYNALRSLIREEIAICFTALAKGVSAKS